MAQMRPIACSAIVINNEVVPIKPNSASFNRGLGANTTAISHIANGVVDVMGVPDPSQCYGILKFSLVATKENDDRLIGWWRVNGDIAIGIIDERSRLTLTFENAFLIKCPDEKISTDGDFEVEFHSNPAK